MWELLSKHHSFFGPLEKLQTQERWKAHYKTLRDEKKRKAEEDRMKRCKMLQDESSIVEHVVGKRAFG